MGDLSRGTTFTGNIPTAATAHALVDSGSINKEFITDKTAVDCAASDKFVISDASDGNVLKSTTGLSIINAIAGATGSALIVAGSAEAAQTAIGAVSSTLTTNQIYVGNAGSVATGVSVSGDVTIDSTGSVTIGANKVTPTMLGQGSAYTTLANIAGSTGNVAAATALSMISMYSTNRPSFLAHKNDTAQTGIANGSATKLTFPTESWDTGGYYAAGSSFWTPPAGLVIAYVATYYSGGVSANGQFKTMFYKNGASIREYLEWSSTTAVSPSCLFFDIANGTDYYEFYTYAATGSTAAISGSSLFTYAVGVVL